MARNLDLTALRSFAAVADSGGVTRAATQLNLTQSAVSMQLKRLEEQLGLELLDRSGRSIALTAQGEQLLGYARRLLGAQRRGLGADDQPGLRGRDRRSGCRRTSCTRTSRGCCSASRQEYPRVRVHAARRTYTIELKAALRPRRDRPDPDHRGGGRRPAARCWRASRWSGSGREGGQAWRARPLRFGSTARCVFRRPAIEALERGRAALGARGRFDLLLGGRGQRHRRPRGLRAARRARSRRAARRSATAARCRSCPSYLRQHVRRRGAARGAGRSGWRPSCARPTASADCAWRRSSRAPPIRITTLPVARRSRSRSSPALASSSGSTWLTCGRSRPWRCQAKSAARLRPRRRRVHARPGAEVEADHRQVLHQQPVRRDPRHRAAGEADRQDARPRPGGARGRRRRARRPRARRPRRRRRAP